MPDYQPVMDILVTIHGCNWEVTILIFYHTIHVERKLCVEE